MESESPAMLRIAQDGVCQRGSPRRRSILDLSVLPRRSIRLARARKCAASLMHASFTSLSDFGAPHHLDEPRGNQYSKQDRRPGATASLYSGTGRREFYREEATFVTAITSSGEDPPAHLLRQVSAMKIITASILASAIIAASGTVVVLSIQPQRAKADEPCVGVSCWPVSPPIKHSPAYRATLPPVR